MAPTIFSYFQHIFLYNLIKNPQITIALTFLTHNISGIGGVITTQWLNLPVLVQYKS